MPGLFGLITKKPRVWAEEQLSVMAGTVRHEDFYSVGNLGDESLGLYVGWSVHQDAFAADMPVRSSKGDTTLLFSGEEYPDKRDVQQYAQGENRLSYLCGMYHGSPNFPEKLNGMFHGVLADHRTGTTILFNDRFGMHRLYYHESKDAFYFAAEAKSILAVRPVLRTPDLQGLGEFVSTSCVLENRTIFSGIRVLPPASVWKFQNRSILNKGSYFHPQEWENQTLLDPEAYYGALKDVISRTLPRYFEGSQPIGMTVTGGLDTRVIMAWHRAVPETLPCYTFGGMYRDCQDVRVAKRVAHECAQQHQVIRVDKEFLTRFAYYAERSVYLTEGCIDVYRSPDLFVSQKARAIAPVKVVGTYGSEILGQAVMFKPVQPDSDIFDKELTPYVDCARQTYAEVLNAHPVTFAAFKQSPWWHYGVLALEKTQLTVRSPFLDNEFVRTVYRSPVLKGSSNDIRLRLIKDGNPALASFQTDRGIGGVSSGILARARRAFLEFTFRAEWAYDYGMPQWLAQLDHGFAPLHLERLYLGRHKLTHFRVWYRDALADYLRDTLLDVRALSRTYVQRKGVERIVNAHLRGNRNYTTQLHKLLTLELLHRLFFDTA